MSFDAFDDWDANFLDQAAQLEEAAISARNATQPTSPLPLPLPLIPHVSFSPPRELSQRFPDTSDSLHHNEIENLKRELGRVSKQLTHLEHECVELRKDRDKKEEQLKGVFVQLEAKDAEIHNLKRINVEDEASVRVCPQESLHARTNATTDHQVGARHPVSGTKGTLATPWMGEGMSKRSSHNTKNTLERGPTGKKVQVDGFSTVSELKRRVLIDNASTTSNGCSIQEDIFLEKNVQLQCSKAVGTQTDIFEDANYFKNEEFLQNGLSNKLLSIWGSHIEKGSVKSPFSKLLTKCLSDLYALCRCTSLSSKITLNDPVGESIFDVTLLDDMPSVHSVEAAKVSRLYMILTKITSEMPRLDVLVESLLDLCVLENVVVVHRSLCILRNVLQHMLCFDLRSDSRDNIVVSHGQCSDILEEEQNIFAKNNEKVHNQVQLPAIMDGRSSLILSFSSTRPTDVENPWTRQHGNFGDSLASSVNLFSLFETMRRIAVGSTEECIREEAISIMNLILIRSDPYSERERFGLMPLFESISRLLQKEAGLSVQQQALRLLFLLLNCGFTFSLKYFLVFQTRSCNIYSCSSSSSCWI